MTTTSRPLRAHLARGAAVLSGTVSLALVGAGAALAQAPTPTPPPVPAPENDPNFNPLQGVTPNSGAWGSALNNSWTKLAGGIWFVLLAAAALGFLASWTKVRQARKGGYGNDTAEAMRDVQYAGVAIVGLLMTPVLIGAFIFITR